MTAQQLFDHVANAIVEGAISPRETLSPKSFWRQKNYNNEFPLNLLPVNNTAEKILSQNLKESEKREGDMFEIMHGLASFMFIIGAKEMSWLDTWRQTKILNQNTGYQITLVLRVASSYLIS
ncbi:hypothetical protein GcM1_249082 [Golovinomyces cichoracearum]|uniref:Uncharacterized protein n=1 Tax=Golovinomyces cichoracearum TaxID=62708 RepID=A0A420IBQ2_9PEZI|nr:hypothetical protein GcM1_249082 [Golovinomyces cichoracearum]